MKTERLLTETKRTCLTKTLLHHGSMPVMSPVDSHHLLGVLRGVEVLALSRVKQPDPVAQLAEFLHTPRPIFEGECERLFFCLVAQRLSQSLLQHAEIMKRAGSTRRRAKAKKKIKGGEMK